jgi:hypothetical protein
VFWWESIPGCHVIWFLILAITNTSPKVLNETVVFGVVFQTLAAYNHVDVAAG